ncbi:AAA family ATPase [Leuconostoc fallax]|uniref:AAA family ATPase n=1 Tax=Leuconostoc fallax TaxID=1251 RepID=UPI000495F4E2|nr:AAA family ATPase [Leuconostoc fallax]
MGKTKGNQQTLSLDTLFESYSLLFQDDSSVYETFSKINLHNVISFNNNVILQKHISGSSESQIGIFIDYLQNSDWVRAGKDYIDGDRNECPFCQQSLPTNFRKQLEEYFDETFQEDVHTLNTFISSYNSFVKN